MHLAIFCVFLPFGLATTLKQLPPTDEFDTAGAAPIKASYIVEMKSEFDSVESILSSVGDSSADKYLDAFNGFVASLTDNQLKMLQANPKVKHIEANTRFQIEFSEMSKVAHKQSTFGDVVSIKQNPPSSQTMQWGYKSFIPWTKETKMYKKKESLLFEKDAEWNLARISHRKPKRTSYVYDKSAGSGTCVYVIDSGIDTSHPLFEGRAKFVKSFLRDSKLSYKDYPQKDMFGHGTHVAGIIGSSTFGVAKNTTLYSLKVTDKNGGGEAFSIIAAMRFVLRHAPTQYCPRGVVVNMSLGVLRSQLINNAAEKIQQAGYFLAVAAGNAGMRTKFFSPASAESACTVSATQRDDRISYFTNYGPEVSILAPGVHIKSTWPVKKGYLNTLSGTSMASPHVAGLGAYYMGMIKNPGDMCSLICETALKGVIKNDGPLYMLPNLLINNRKPSGRYDYWD